MTTPVWESARGTARQWQDEALVGDAFWAALDVASDEAKAGGAERQVEKGAKGKQVKKGTGKKPIRSVHLPVGPEHQTVTEQVATFLAQREASQLQTHPEHLADHMDLEVTGAEDVAGRACDVVRTTVRQRGAAAAAPGLPVGLGELTYQLWVDSERLVILRAVKLVDDEPAEIVEFLDIAFDD